MSSVFLLQGAMVTQNEHVELQQAGDSLIQYVQHRLCPFRCFWFFWPPLFLRLVDGVPHSWRLEWAYPSPPHPYWSSIKFYAVAYSLTSVCPLCAYVLRGLWLFQMFSKWVGPGSRVTCSNKESQTHLSSSIWVRDIFFSLIFLFYWSSQKPLGCSCTFSSDSGP